MAHTQKRDYIDYEPDQPHEAERPTINFDENPGITKAQMAIHFIVGVIGSLLIIRFLLALFGANAQNSFVDLVYTVTAPLVAPFNGLFSIDATAGGTRFEFEALIATIVYTLLGLALVRFLDIFRDSHRHATTRQTRAHN